MRILMLAHRIPYPPHTGDKNRPYHVARHLARRHAVTLVFPVDDPEDLPGVDALREAVGPEIDFAPIWKPWAVAKGLAGLARGRPLTLGYFGSRALRARVAARLAEHDYDLIYVSSSSMAQYAAPGRAPVVMDFVDVDSDKWAQYAERSAPPLGWVYRAEGHALRRYEAAVARWARLCIVTTPVEETLLRSFAPWARTAVIPNGIDLAKYQPLAADASEPALIFTGAMDYRPNIDAVQYFHDAIFPRVRQEIPEVRFYIVGLNPAPSVRRLGETPRVIVTGTVADVRPYYARASVCVAPLRLARGVQNKVLQAMAMGLPVVATSRACQGLAAEPGKHLHVEDEPAAFASRVVTLLRSPGERRVLGRQGRAFVEAHHAWESSLARLDTFIAKITAASPVTPPSAFETSSASVAGERAGVRIGETATP